MEDHRIEALLHFEVITYIKSGFPISYIIMLLLTIINKCRLYVRESD